MSPWTLWGCRNHGPFLPGFPPTLGTSPSPTGTTFASLRSAPASRLNTAILAAHVTSGWAGTHNARGGKCCGSRLSPAVRARPDPVKSRALHPGCDWVRRPEITVSHWLRGGPDARRPAPPRQPFTPFLCYLLTSSLFSHRRWAWGGPSAAMLLRAFLSSGHLC